MPRYGPVRGIRVLTDGRTLADGEVIETDVCVVGAGPAGSTVALELEASGARVVVLETGGFDDPPEGIPGELEGDEYPEIATTRLTGIGGTAASWDADLGAGRMGARLAPLDPIDFEAVAGVPGSGWPFGPAELGPFYERAQALHEAGPFDYERVRDAAGPCPLGPQFENRLFRFGLRTVWTRTHRQRLGSSGAVAVVANATATAIDLDPGGMVARGVRVSTAPGRTFTVRARATVLAAGGLECTRLLLLAEHRHDLLGHGFTDHPTARCRAEPVAGASLSRLFAPFDLRTGPGGHPMLRAFGLTADALRGRSLLNSAFFPIPVAEREAAVLAAAKEIGGAVRHGRRPTHPRRALGTVLRDPHLLGAAAVRKLARRAPRLSPLLRRTTRTRLLNTLAVGEVMGWSASPRLARSYAAFDLYQMTEQAVDDARRVTLGSTRDRFGLPVVHLRWQLGERTLADIDAGQRILADALAETGPARLVTSRELIAQGMPEHEVVHPSIHHHLGTTRMHADPRHGVVDSDGAVHGCANLFVVGSSVFPRAGCANPTLTVVALAVRLAAHLGTALPGRGIAAGASRRPRSSPS